MATTTDLSIVNAEENAMSFSVSSCFGAQSDWTIIQISDTHLMSDPQSTFVDMNPEHSFHAVIADIQRRFAHVDALIHTGDLAQVATSNTYQRYLSFMQQTGIPHYQIPGNHDDVSLFPFYQQQDQVHILHLGTWSIILLNSAVDQHIHGWISQAHLEQLEILLTQYAQQHIIITCHHHPFEMHSHWIDQHKLKNSPQLTDILSKHQNVKIVLSGHVHQASAQVWQHLQFFSTPSTCVQFKPLSHNFALDHRAPGYRVLKLNANGQFHTKVIRLKHDQFHINTEISGY